MTPEQSTKYLEAAGHRFEQMLRGQISQRQIEHPTEDDVKMIENLHRDGGGTDKAGNVPENRGAADEAREQRQPDQGVAPGCSVNISEDLW
jgi:hypothetical protein